MAAGMFAPGWACIGKVRGGLARRGVAVILAAGMLAGCGAEPAAMRPTEGIVVDMTDRLRFEPATLAVARGETVTFFTSGSAPHNVVTDPALAKEPAHAVAPEGVERWASPMVERGESWQYTFETPGVYTYFCQPHEALGMVGTITVTE